MVNFWNQNPAAPGVRTGTPPNDPLARFSGYGTSPAYQQESIAQNRAAMNAYTPSQMPGLTAMPRSSMTTPYYSSGLSSGGVSTGVNFGGPSATGGSSPGGSTALEEGSDADLQALLGPARRTREQAAERLRRLGLTQRHDIRETSNRGGTYGSGPMMEEERRQREAEMQTLGDMEAGGSADELAYIASFRQAQRQRRLQSQQATEQIQAARDIANQQNQFAMQQADQANSLQRWQMENQLAQQNWAQNEAARRAGVAGPIGAVGQAGPAGVGGDGGGGGGGMSFALPNPSMSGGRNLPAPIGVHFGQPAAPAGRVGVPGALPPAGGGGADGGIPTPGATMARAGEQLYVSDGRTYAFNPRTGITRDIETGTLYGLGSGPLWTSQNIVALS